MVSHFVNLQLSPVLISHGTALRTDRGTSSTRISLRRTLIGQKLGVMGFVGIYRALYDYAPQGENELTIAEGDLLYVIEKSREDDWWKAKKKASGDEEEEPVGLIPNNYVKEVCVFACPY